MVKHFGGVVESSNKREYGRANLSLFDMENTLFDNVKPNSQVWMSHGAIAPIFIPNCSLKFFSSLALFFC